MHGPKNNLNLLITIEPVKAGADATVLYRMSRVYAAPAVTGLVFMQGQVWQVQC